MYTKRDFKVGEYLYFIVFGRRHFENEISKTKIEKIGVKYLIVERFKKIFINDLTEVDYLGNRTQFYKNINECTEEFERINTKHSLYRKFNFATLDKLNLNQLKAIQKIIEESENNV